MLLYISVIFFIRKPANTRIHSHGSFRESQSTRIHSCGSSANHNPHGFTLAEAPGATNQTNSPLATLSQTCQNGFLHSNIISKRLFMKG